MSVDVIQAKYDSLDVIAARFGRSLHDTSQLHQRLTRSLRALEDGGWKGQGASAFFGEMHSQMLPAMQRLAQALAEARAVTLEAKKIMQAAEEEAARPFRGSAAGASAKDRINAAMDGWGTDEAAIKEIVANATAAERQALWSDAAFMEKVRSELSTQEYLDFVVSVGMFQAGTVSHLSAADADAAIQKHLQQYLGEAVKDGRKVSGSVAVVGDSDWDAAGIAHYGEDRWTSGKRDDINGFVDSSGRVWIHKDRGNPGTMIHEAVHKYSDEAMIKVSQPLNEGVTEYFTRSVGSSLHPPPDRGNYQTNYRFVQSLVSLVGEDVVAKAYFDGNMDGLRQAFIDAGKSESDWTKMIEHTKKGEWNDAKKLAKR